MRFKAFQNFSLGKLIDKHKKDKPGAEDTPGPPIDEIVAETSVKTRDGEKAAKKLHEPVTLTGIITLADDIPVRPHGPAAELSVEPVDIQSGGIELGKVAINDSPKIGEEVKITEVSAEKVAAAPKGAPVAVAVTPVAEKKEEKKEEKPDDADSLNRLFSSDEEEANPLASLINSLPDVTARELMDDLAEIHRIIKEWRPSSK
jgi:hypothetical protein